MIQDPPKWHKVFRNDAEKCVFVGKDGCSGLIRAKDKSTGKPYEWRTTDSLSRESGLSKKRVEEILEYWANKKVVRQHSKDPEKWGYWEIVGNEKEDPDVVAKDHESRMDKHLGKKLPMKTNPAAPANGFKLPSKKPTQPKTP